jgi:hypothetical protein
LVAEGDSFAVDGPFGASGSVSLGGPFTMIGGDDAAACEGDACVIPAAVSAIGERLT